MLEHAATGLNTFSFAARFDGNHDGHLFVFGDFVEINMENAAVQRMMLNFLQQRETLAIVPTARSTRRFSEAECESGLERFGVDFEVLGFVLPSVDDSRNAAGGAQLLDTTAATKRARKRVQRYRFHFSLISSMTGLPTPRRTGLTGAPAFKFK